MQKHLFFLLFALLIASGAGAQGTTCERQDTTTSQAQAQPVEKPCPAFIVTMHPDGDPQAQPVTFKYSRSMLQCGDFCTNGAERIVKAWETENGDGITVRHLQTATHLFTFTFARKNHNGLAVYKLGESDFVAFFGS